MPGIKFTISNPFKQMVSRHGQWKAYDLKRKQHGLSGRTTFQRIQHFMLDVLPEEPPCFVAGMGMGGPSSGRPDLETEAKAKETKLFLSIINEAETQIPLLENHSDIPDLYLSLAEVMFNTGDHNKGLKFVSDAYDAAIKFRTYENRDTLHHLVQTLELTGYRDEAFEYIEKFTGEVDKLKNFSDRLLIFMLAARAAEHLGNKRGITKYISRAIENANKLEEDDTRYRYLIVFAGMLNNVGEAARASSLISEARLHIDQIVERSDEDADWICMYVDELVAAGFIDHALEVSNRIVDTEYRGGALGNIVNFLVNNDNLDQALIIANDIPSKKYKSVALSCIAAALVKKGEREKAHNLLAVALKLFKEIKDEEDVSIASEAIVPVLVQLKQTDQAEMIIDGNSQLNRKEVASKYICALIDNDSIDYAADYAEKNGYNKAPYMLYIFAKAYLGKGNINKALEIQASLGDLSIKIDVARILAQRDPQIAALARVALLKQKIIEEMGSQDLETRRSAIQFYFEMRWQDPGVTDLLVDIMYDRTVNVRQTMAELAKTNPALADIKINEFLAVNPFFIEDNLDFLAGLADKYSLAEIAAKVSAAKQRIEAESLRLRQEEAQKKRDEEKRKAISQIFAEVSRAIIDQLREALSIKAEFSFDSYKDDDSAYGTIALKGQDLKEKLITGEKLLPAYSIGIIEGETIAEAEERLITLSILVPHEVMHKLQWERDIKEPAIGSYQRLDFERAQGQANEIMLDRLALDSAIKIYVYGKGNYMFNEATREVIAINAYLTLSKIILREGISGKHNLAAEFIARKIAVLSELSQSSRISLETKKELLALINGFKKMIIIGRDPEKEAELIQLINEYRRIFVETKDVLLTYLN